MRPTEGPILCVDIGGTKIRTVLLTQEGSVLQEEQLSTPAQEIVEVGLQAIFAVVERLLAQQRIGYRSLLGIGIGAPGLVDPPSGTLWEAPHLPLWRDVPLLQRVQQHTGARTVVGNDATLAALGEHRYGAGKGTQHMLYITISTGIGGGLICDGHLQVGRTGAAGEIGHMALGLDGPACACGNRGCLESLASGSAIQRQALEALQRPEGSSSLLQSYREEITAEAVFAAAARGDALAQSILARAAEALGVGLASLVNLLDPELIVVGGGLSNQPGLLLEPAVAHMRQRAYQRLTGAVRVERAALGENAVIYGALAAVLDRVKIAAGE